MPSGLIVGTLHLRGHLAESIASDAFSSIDPSATALLVNALEMTSYEAAARDAFVKWSAGARDRMARVAVVTEKTSWWMVVSAMGLASGQQMKAFSTIDAARAWLLE